MAETEVVDDETYLEEEKDETRAQLEGYNSLSSILEKCGAQRLLPKFVEDDLLLQLNLDSDLEWNPVASLQPTIGARAKFRIALKELQVR